MKVYYNPLDKAYKNPTGAISDKDTLTLSVKTEGVSECFLEIKKDGDGDYKRYKMDCTDGVFTFTGKFGVGLYFYRFNVGCCFIALSKDHTGTLTGSPHDFQLSVYKSSYKVPSWLTGGIIYQIFPDRFYRAEKVKTIAPNKLLHDKWGETPVYESDEDGIVRNNDFFGGDFKGIEQKLPYLKSLSVTAIYLNPIFKANSNHRYDTGDYNAFDELLGTEEDFKRLVKSAAEQGIKIILDGVFNHTGDDSVYFNKYGNYDSVGAYQSKDSPYYHWYKFIDYPKE